MVTRSTDDVYFGLLPAIYHRLQFAVRNRSEGRDFLPANSKWSIRPKTAILPSGSLPQSLLDMAGACCDLHVSRSMIESMQEILANTDDASKPRGTPYCTVNFLKLIRTP